MRIPLRNDENHVCACSERPPRVPAGRSAIGTLINHEPTGPGDDLTGRRPAKTYLMPLTDDTAPRVFIGYKEASGRPATLDEGWRFAFEILALVDGLEA